MGRRSETGALKAAGDRIDVAVYMAARAERVPGAAAGS